MDKFRVMAGEAIELNEAAYNPSKGQITVTIIKPGLSKNNRFYSADMLKKSVGIFENCKMFANHQTDAEAKARPEGSVNQYVAQMTKSWAESDGTLKGLATVIDPQFKAKLDLMHENKMLPNMGVSIRAVGEANKAKMSGKDVVVVESLLSARSVDFVTFAGAGGQVEAIESDASLANDIDLMTEAQLRERRPDLVELVESRKEQSMEEVKEGYCPPMSASDHSAKAASFQSKADELKAGDKKTAFQGAADAHSKAADAKSAATKAESLAQLQAEESAPQNAAILKENEELKAKLALIESSAKKTAAQAEIAKLVTESKLPEVAAIRVKKHFEASESIEGVAEYILVEAEYVKSLKTVVKNNGAGDNKQVTEAASTAAKESLKKTIQETMGFTKEQAEIFAA